MMDLFDQKGIQPMLISEQVEPYDDDGSIFELKLDGCRCIAYLDGNGVDLRNKRDRRLLCQFPELEHIHQNCHGKCILDGELIVPVKGKPDFYQLQKRTLVLDGELRETQTANYFSDVYPIDCTVSPANALFCRKNGTLLQAGNLL